MITWITWITVELHKTSKSDIEHLIYIIYPFITTDILKKHNLIIVYEISTEKQDTEIQCFPEKFLKLNFVTFVSK